MVIQGYIFNTLLYLLLANIILPQTTILGGMAAASQYCHPTTAEAARGMMNNTACTRQDLMAFQMVSFINLSYLGLLGTYTFFTRSSSKHYHSRYYNSSSSSSTPIGRCFGSQTTANTINAAIVIFQGWDFIMTYIFTTDDKQRIIMLIHHAIAFICGYFCLIYEVSKKNEKCICVDVMFRFG
jgi:hypothetical protein